MSFYTELHVRIGDINYGGHVGHDRFITLLHQARLDLLRSLGANELDCFGVGLIMRRLECDYLGEAFLNDLLTVEMFVSDVRPSRFLIHYDVRRSTRKIARAVTQMVAFDYSTRKVCPLPEVFQAALISQVLMGFSND